MVTRTGTHVVFSGVSSVLMCKAATSMIVHVLYDGTVSCGLRDEFGKDACLLEPGSIR